MRTTTTTSTTTATTTTSTTTDSDLDIVKEVDLTLLYAQYAYDDNTESVELNADYGEYGDVYGGISNKFGTDEERTGLEELVQPETPAPPVVPPTEIEQPPQSPPAADLVVEKQIVEPVTGSEVTIDEENDGASQPHTEDEVKPNETQHIQVVNERIETQQAPVKVIAPPNVNPPTRVQQANWPVRQASAVSQRKPPASIDTSGRNYNSAGYSDGNNDSYKDDNINVEPTLKCWHCDAMSFEECQEKGEERSCHANEVSLLFNCLSILTVIGFMLSRNS